MLDGSYTMTATWGKLKQHFALLDFTRFLFTNLFITVAYRGQSDIIII